MEQNEIMKAELAYQIEKYLYKNNISTLVFANLCRLTPNRIQNAIAVQDISINEMVKICDALGIFLDVLRHEPSDEFLYRAIVSQMERILRRIHRRENQVESLKKALITLGVAQWEWRRYRAWILYGLNSTASGLEIQQKPVLIPGLSPPIEEKNERGLVGVLSEPKENVN